MSDIAINVENISKIYELGMIGSSSLRETIMTNVKKLTGKKNENAGQEFWALRDISFDVRQGEVLGVIGRNGAGKSTLLKVLSRITEPSRGRITLNGRVASLLEVGTGFHPELTGRENIFLNGSILGMTRQEIRQKFDEIVDFSGVEKFIDTPVKRYSSGMYVRLAFSVAAHLEPEVLVVDEVLSVGDAAFRKKCIGKMSEVSSQQGRTILFVSHNMAAVRVLCGRGILLEAGEVAFTGEIDATVQEYSRRNAESGIETQYINKTPDTTKAQILDIKVLDEDGKLIIGDYNYDKRFHLAVTIDVPKGLEDGYLAMSVRDSLDNVLLGSKTSDTIKQVLQTGKTTYQVTIPSALFTGQQLFFTFALSHGVHGVQHRVHNKICLNLIDTVINKVGIIGLDLEWQKV